MNRFFFYSTRTHSSHLWTDYKHPQRRPVSRFHPDTKDGDFAFPLVVWVSVFFSCPGTEQTLLGWRSQESCPVEQQGHDLWLLFKLSYPARFSDAEKAGQTWTLGEYLHTRTCRRAALGCHRDHKAQTGQKSRPAWKFSNFFCLPC